MKNKKFNLFVTSNDVENFGTSYSVSKFSVYFLVSCFGLVLVFSFVGFYFLVFYSPQVILSSEIKDSSSKIIFSKDPVKPKNNSDFETSFITSNFDKNHIGIDINGNIGTKIYSPMDGKVIYSGFDKKFGNSIIISHKNGCVTKYMHNKTNFVNSGDNIKIDKAIAEMGNSGSTVKNEGIHLHFELWKDGKVVDPAIFIKNLKVVDIDTFVSK
jgi:murein DD-endopeptidase MepM/ murein hydrolase activator NlpD